MDYYAKQRLTYLLGYILRTMWIIFQVVGALAFLATALAFLAFATMLGVQAAYYVFGMFTLTLLL